MVCFLEMPDLIFFMVVAFLDNEDIISVKQVCRKTYYLVRSAISKEGTLYDMRRCMILRYVHKDFPQISNSITRIDL